MDFTKCTNACGQQSQKSPTFVIANIYVTLFDFLLATTSAFSWRLAWDVALYGVASSELIWEALHVHCAGQLTVWQGNCWYQKQETEASFKLSWWLLDSFHKMVVPMSQQLLTRLSAIFFCLSSSLALAPTLPPLVSPSSQQTVSKREIETHE